MKNKIKITLGPVDCSGDSYEVLLWSGTARSRPHYLQRIADLYVSRTQPTTYEPSRVHGYRLMDIEHAYEDVLYPIGVYRSADYGSAAKAKAAIRAEIVKALTSRITYLDAAFPRLVLARLENALREDEVQA